MTTSLGLLRSKLKRTPVSFVQSMRALDMQLEQLRSRVSIGRKRVFNLDAHISVFRDLEMGFRDFPVFTTSWSISGHNHLVRRFFKTADPVQIITESNWKDLDSKIIVEFREKYRRFLDSFDGFVACYPPSFVRIYEETGKPILSVVATRYEHPHTLDISEWGALDSSLKKGTLENRLRLVANNHGDADYLDFFTGISPEVLPSLCDYTGETWRGSSGSKVFYCRSQALENKIVEETQGSWVPVRKALGASYTWSKLANVSEVLVIPYNISTMTLFELATMGVPVSVPSRSFMRTLADSYDGVLSELSFYQVHGASTSELSEANPNNFNSKTFFDWWLDRADFYSTSLMPNVRTIESFNELNGRFNVIRTHKEILNLREKTSNRNEMIRKQRELHLGAFLDEL